MQKAAAQTKIKELLPGQIRDKAAELLTDQTRKQPSPPVKNYRGHTLKDRRASPSFF